MTVKLELLRNYITDFIKYKIEDFDAIEKLYIYLRNIILMLVFVMTFRVSYKPFLISLKNIKSVDLI